MNRRSYRTGARRHSYPVQSNEDIDSLRDLASGAPVVRAVNNLLEKAIELRATDIHVEPFRTGMALRMRVDGLLQVVPSPADVLPTGADLADQDYCRPQHCRKTAAARRTPLICTSRDRTFDIRVATMPTRYGEVRSHPVAAKRSRLLESQSLASRIMTKIKYSAA